MLTVFTNGCFDILTPAHVRFLTDARRLGNRLIVGLNSDASVRRLKGEGRPINDQGERYNVLKALRCVDEVVIFDEDTPHKLIHRLRPRILVKGGDYSVDEVVAKELVEEYGGRVCVTERKPGLCTTEIIETMKRTR